MAEQRALSMQEILVGLLDDGQEEYDYLNLHIRTFNLLKFDSPTSQFISLWRYFAVIDRGPVLDLSEQRRTFDRIYR